MPKPATSPAHPDLAPDFWDAVEETLVAFETSKREQLEGHAYRCGAPSPRECVDSVLFRLRGRVAARDLVMNDPNHFAAIVFRAVREESFSRRRDEKRREELEADPTFRDALVPVSFDLEDAMDAKRCMDRLDAARAELPEDARSVVELLLAGVWSPRELANILQITRDAAKRRRDRAIVLLRRATQAVGAAVVGWFGRWRAHATVAGAALFLWIMMRPEPACSPTKTRFGAIHFHGQCVIGLDEASSSAPEVRASASPFPGVIVVSDGMVSIGTKEFMEGGVLQRALPAIAIRAGSYALVINRSDAAILHCIMGNCRELAPGEYLRTGAVPPTWTRRTHALEEKLVLGALDRHLVESHPATESGPAVGWKERLRTGGGIDGYMVSAGGELVTVAEPATPWASSSLASE
ncbi:MAG: hypothetical protein IT377_07305 [Polyangiaceae bacterium]|nr:hypothetical protein [Polyangiaceae bacterium]